MAEILTVEQVARKLHVRPYTVREYLKHGKIPGRKIGRSWLVIETELDVFLMSGSLPLSSEPRSLKAADIAGKYARPRISALGKHKRPGRSVEDFMREKHEEIEEEERRWQERHKA